MKAALDFDMLPGRSCALCSNKLMILDATCHISYTSNAPIPAVMMLRPRSGYAQWITREEYIFEPHAPVVEYTDKFGNLCQRVLIPKGKFDVHYGENSRTEMHTRSSIWTRWMGWMSAAVISISAAYVFR